MGVVTQYPNTPVVVNRDIAGVNCATVTVAANCVDAVATSTVGCKC